MIETPTVLILGAGASAPYGYPVGTELKDKIIHSLNGMVDNDNGWVYDLDISTDLVREFTFKFVNSKRPSIDSFLNKQREEFTEIGKIAIVDAISKCEKTTIHSPMRLKQDGTMDHTDDWYSNLVEILYECDVDQIGRNLSIISYNYDRSLEYFFLRPLQGTFKELESIEDCAIKIAKIPIIHMYGRLEPLPWEKHLYNSYNASRDYGKKCSSDDLLKISNNIKLIHEAKDNVTKYDADNLIKKADKIYFLGMDLYRNRENVNILDISLFDGKTLLATGYGLEQGERNRITNFFRHIPKVKVRPNFNISASKTLMTIRGQNPF